MTQRKKCYGLGVYTFICVCPTLIYFYLEASGRGWPAHVEKEETSGEQ